MIAPGKYRLKRTVCHTWLELSDDHRLQTHVFKGEPGTILHVTDCVCPEKVYLDQPEFLIRFTTDNPNVRHVIEVNASDLERVDQ